MDVGRTRTSYRPFRREHHTLVEPDAREVAASDVLSKKKPIQTGIVHEKSEAVLGQKTRNVTVRHNRQITRRTCARHEPA